ncbi:hypothetical protein [Cellulosilyticum ruminicola]|uniref:hypothetical protein n=1 Tax=Cellulosilyticum ruminicola TaxID=425254 RepID=UPI0006D19D0C|nr:hypothetical protein [Cellulosilyticum ruminicola]
MKKYMKVLAMGLVTLSIVGCGNVGKNASTKEETSNTAVEESNQSQTFEESSNEEVQEPYVYDAGYTDLIHGGFVQAVQGVMETMYSRINYSSMGIAVEDLTMMDDNQLLEVEEMAKSLNPIRDEKILKVVKATRGLFDKTNALLEAKTYEKLTSLNDEGQAIYDQYYEWLIEAAKNHHHEEE